MDVQICVDYKELSFVLHVTEMNYVTGCSALRFQPAEPDSAEATDGWVELDGDVSDITYITSADMDIIMQLGNDDKALFDEVCEVNYAKIEERLLEYAEKQREDAEMEAAEYRYNELVRMGQFV